MQEQALTSSLRHPIIVAAVGRDGQKTVAKWLQSPSIASFVLEDDLHHDLDRAYSALKLPPAVSRFAAGVAAKIFGIDHNQKSCCWIVPDILGVPDTEVLARAKIELLMSVYDRARLILCHPENRREVDVLMNDNHDAEASALLALFPGRCELRSTVADLSKISATLG